MNERAVNLSVIALIISCKMAFADPPAAENTKHHDGDKPVPAASAHQDLVKRFTVDAARDRARWMHDIYSATLDVMHHRYFHGGRSIVPARAMEDVFEEIQAQSSIEARWISVNLKAMSIHHKPESDFEKRAAKEIADGKSEVEAIEDGFYRRVGAISMAGSCISCHDGFFKQPTSKPKFAGLVISVPVLTQDEKADKP